MIQNVNCMIQEKHKFKYQIQIFRDYQKSILMNAKSLSLLYISVPFHYPKGYCYDNLEGYPSDTIR